MNIERVLQITIALLAAMATLLLGMSSGSLALPLAAIFAAASSLYVTDRYGWVYLNRNIANLAAVTAVLISIHDFFQLERERQLLAIAYLLIYLQIVLLYQRKTIRIYWQLLMLSLLQVVVAAALNFGLQFGILLAIYMFLALFALRLFFVVREQARCRLPGRAEGLESGKSLPGKRLARGCGISSRPRCRRAAAGHSDPGADLPRLFAVAPSG